MTSTSGDAGPDTGPDTDDAGSGSCSGSDSSFSIFFTQSVTIAGLLMVFEAFEKASYAIVLKANRPLKVLDKVKNP